MFRRTAKPQPETVQVEKPDGKGRPTPTRKEAQAAAKERARMGMDKKSAQKVLRERRAQDNQKMREGMRTGDQRYLMERDKGPVRAFVRDYVDTRISFMEYLLPVLVLIMALQFAGQQQLSGAALVGHDPAARARGGVAALAAQQGDPHPVPRGEHPRLALLRADAGDPAPAAADAQAAAEAAPTPAQALLTLPGSYCSVEPHRAVDLTLALEQGDRGRALVGELGPELADPRLGLGAGGKLLAAVGRLDGRAVFGLEPPPPRVVGGRGHSGLLDVGLHERGAGDHEHLGAAADVHQHLGAVLDLVVEQRQRDALAQRR